ncbi:MAG: peptidyl-dipeptidase Dcp [Alphaproteobacteria bacterium]|jgi:peptidyl-dipeptidase Dcp|nr:peptidyl-dipeptidase Dcp [Alphaproteobacteria bacterium]
MTQQNHPSAPDGASNPFFDTWTGPFGVPPFARIAPEHFEPAFERAFAEHDAEIAAIAGGAAEPTFRNTIEALELAGRALDGVSSVFGVLTGAHTNDALEAIERDISPRRARHWSAMVLNEPLFRRIDALWQRRDALGLGAEQARVLERYHLMFKRAGAGLDAASKKRLAEITERLATLGTTFSQNVLADERDYTLVLETEEDRAGLPDFVLQSARGAATERGMTGRYVVTLGRSSVEPFLQFSSRRDLREKIFRAWIARGGNGGKTDNKAIIAEALALRAERARLLGYNSFAHYRLDDAMAKTPEAVRGLLDRVWAPARLRALADRDAMQALIQEEGGNFKLAPWDWRYYAEKLRMRQCDLDETTIKPYFQLHHIVEAAFYTAYKLFGLSFERKDVTGWHPDVQAWEVRGADGRHVGLFMADYFSRPSKRSGAWMTTLRDQEKLARDIRPLVVNVANFSKAGGDQPTLLSFDDARTLFHEFGHALHGLLSDVTYPAVSCTSVLTDWVELPSQLYEHWLERPEILSRFAVHSRTGQPMPDDLMRRLIAARTFNQGFATVEYVASALVDLEFHLLQDAEGFDVNAFEDQALARIGMPAEIVMRHRPTHFAHVFSGGGYAAAYYSYMWSEVLDADAFAAFEETGDIFDPATARALRDHVYAAGGARDPENLYKAFRGRLPTPEALLRRRGLTEAPAA